jgi:hypothetical protein
LGQDYLTPKKESFNPKFSGSYCGKVQGWFPIPLDEVRPLGIRRGKKTKGKDAPLPMPNLPPPGEALPPAPLPLPPGAPALPAPGGLPIPAPLPAPLPAPGASPSPAPVPVASPIPLPNAEPVNDPNTSLSGIAEEKGYNELWAKRSEKPLQQIYGHIDRISNKEAGSLLDRYADRFGHSLDREIIVMRKAAVEEKMAEVRDAPVVELLDGSSDEENTMTELEMVENELRTLKPLYQEAKALGDKESLAELTPTLQSLMAQRKALKSTGATSETTANVAHEAEESDSDDLFVQFVGIVDDLLGDHLPGSIVEAFMESPEFEVYRQVVSAPEVADESTRATFYTMVDDQLGNMSEESIHAFGASPEFEIYRIIGDLYKDE